MSDIVERYGDKREKRGEKRTRIGDVKSLMETMALTVDQALDALKGIYEETQEGDSHDKHTSI